MPCIDKNSLREKSLTPKVRIFAGFLDDEDTDRMPPFKSELPESRRNSRFRASSDYTRHPNCNGVESGLMIKAKVPGKMFIA